VVEVSIAQADADNIKSLRMFASSNLTTYMSITDALISDMHSNDIVALSATPDCSSTCFGDCVCESDAIVVSNFTRDTTAPDMVQFSLSLNAAGELSMTFSEAVDMVTLNLTKLVLRNSTSSPSQAFRLTGGDVTSVSLTEFTVVPTVDDLNAIKLLGDLAISNISTFLSVEDEAIFDFAGNAIVAEITSVTTYSDDTQPPAVSRFDLNMSSGIVLVHFSEAIDMSSFDETQIVIQDAARRTDSNFVNLAVSSVSSVSATIVQIDLTLSDLNSLKQNVFPCHKLGNYVWSIRGCNC
jgi:hypothetical protein